MNEPHPYSGYLTPHPENAIEVLVAAALAVFRADPMAFVDRVDEIDEELSKTLFAHSSSLATTFALADALYGTTWSLKGADISGTVQRTIPTTKMTADVAYLLKLLVEGSSLRPARVAPLVPGPRGSDVQNLINSLQESVEADPPIVSPSGPPSSGPDLLIRPPGLPIPHAGNFKMIKRLPNGRGGESESGMYCVQHNLSGNPPACPTDVKIELPMENWD